MLAFLFLPARLWCLVMKAHDVNILQSIIIHWSPDMESVPWCLVSFIPGSTTSPRMFLLENIERNYSSASFFSDAIKVYILLLDLRNRCVFFSVVGASISETWFCWEWWTAWSCVSQVSHTSSIETCQPDRWCTQEGTVYLYCLTVKLTYLLRLRHAVPWWFVRLY